MSEQDDIRAVIAEMRERKVCGGKYESPTLVRWANRLEIEAEKKDELVVKMLAALLWVRDGSVDDSPEMWVAVDAAIDIAQGKPE